MANSFKILTSLFQSLRQVISLQISRLDELSSKDYPYKSSTEHIELIQDIYKKSLKSLEELEQNFSNAKKDHEFNEIEKELIQLSQTLTWISGIALKITSSSTRENVSQNTVFLINHFTKPLKTDAKFLLMPTDEHNYQITHWGIILQQYTKQLEINESELSHKPELFSVLSFPAVYKDNLVAHSLMGHEIGHFIIYWEKLVQSFTKAVNIDTDKMSLLIAMAIKEKKHQQEKDDLPDTAKEKIRTELHNKIRKNIILGAEEILCDLIGFKIMGPVLIFALVEFLLSDTLVYQIGNYYPPPGLRLNILLAEIKQNKYIEKITDRDLSKNFKELIENIEKFTNPEEISDYTIEEQIAYEAWKNMIPELKTITDEVLTRFPELEYSSDLFGKDLPPLVEKLTRLIPPCEIEQEKPANIVSILNAGMVFRLLRKKLLPEVPDNIDDQIDPLVLRGTHQSIIQSTLQEKIKELEIE